MIPFFRKIRYQLAQDNQFFKYSRYAIGEIVLVVIGILIALQINNWNERRKDNIKKTVLKKALIEDLKKDTTLLWNEIRDANYLIQHHEKFINRMEDRDATIDTIIHLFNNNPGVKFDLQPHNRTTYESILSTGDIKTFSDKEIKAIKFYYDKFEFNYNGISDWYDRAYEKNMELFDRFGFLTKENKDNLIYETLTETMDKKEFLRLMDVAEYGFYWAIRISKSRSEELLNESNKLLKFLNDEIN